MEDTLAGLHFPTALDRNLDYDSPCERCLTIPRDFPKELMLETILKIDDSIEEWEASSCKICGLIRFAVASHESWPRVKLELKWYSYEHYRIPYRYRREHPNPNAIGCMRIFNLNSWQYAENRLEVMTYSEGDIEEQSYQRPRPDVDFHLLKRWLASCDTKHQSCIPQPQRSLKDFRVIDVYERTIGNAPENCCYVALSYVWGQLASYGHSEASKLPSKLPLTLEDSLKATQMLGSRYLWVDRLVRPVHVFQVAVNTLHSALIKMIYPIWQLRCSKWAPYTPQQVQLLLPVPEMTQHMVSWCEHSTPILPRT